MFRIIDNPVFRDYMDREVQMADLIDELNRATPSEQEYIIDSFGRLSESEKSRIERETDYTF